MDTTKHTRRRLLGALGANVAASCLAVGTVGGEEIEEASITFEDQQVSRGRNQTVVVSEVRLPEPGGYIDIHDPNDTDDAPLGQIKGAYDEYLEPGVHQNVEIGLFEDFNCHQFEQDRLEESKELMAMPHKDDPNDEEYTHFCGHGDGDVEDGGFGSFPDVVQDSGYVRVPPDGRGNPSDRGRENRKDR